MMERVDFALQYPLVACVSDDKSNIVLRCECNTFGYI